jgi:hypothetical protein
MCGAADTGGVANVSHMFCCCLWWCYKCVTGVVLLRLVVLQMCYCPEAHDDGLEIDVLAPSDDDNGALEGDVRIKVTICEGKNRQVGVGSPPYLPRAP